MTIAEWIKEKGGVAKAAAILKENPRTVAAWIYGEKLPKPQTAQRIIQASKGILDFNGIYAPLFAIQAEKAAKAMMKKGAANE